MLKRIIIIMVAAIALSACSKTDVVYDGYRENAGFFIDKTVPGAYSKAGDILVYNEFEHQMAICAKENSFRIQSDIQDKYFHCAVSDVNLSTLAVGDEVTMKILTAGITTKSKDVYMTLVKAEGNMLWFMDAAGELGVVMTK